jgi:cell division protein FtsB
MFIRKRISPSRRQTPSYQVVETYREPMTGKVKQRVIVNLGSHSEPTAALRQARQDLEREVNRLEQNKQPDAVQRHLRQGLKYARRRVEKDIADSRQRIAHLKATIRALERVCEAMNLPSTGTS